MQKPFAILPLIIVAIYFKGSVSQFDACARYEVIPLFMNQSEASTQAGNLPGTDDQNSQKIIFNGLHRQCRHCGTKSLKKMTRRTCDVRTSSWAN